MYVSLVQQANIEHSLANRYLDVICAPRGNIQRKEPCTALRVQKASLILSQDKLLAVAAEKALIKTMQAKRRV
jgi:hypothetical protein